MLDTATARVARRAARSCSSWSSGWCMALIVADRGESRV